MNGVTITLKRIFEPGRIAFEVPTEPGLKEAISRVLRLCNEKNNDYVAVTLARPYRPRTTGKNSQNHHYQCKVNNQDIAKQ